MSRPFASVVPIVLGFPRVSGDEPTYNAIKAFQEAFSPRERG